MLIHNLNNNNNNNNNDSTMMTKKEKPMLSVAAIIQAQNRWDRALAGKK
jgi:hypothetical protein